MTGEPEDDERILQGRRLHGEAVRVAVVLGRDSSVQTEPKQSRKATPTARIFWGAFMLILLLCWFVYATTPSIIRNLCKVNRFFKHFQGIYTKTDTFMKTQGSRRNFSFCTLQKCHIPPAKCHTNQWRSDGISDTIKTTTQKTEQ